MKKTNEELLEEALDIVPILVNVIENRTDPFEDAHIQLIIADLRHEIFKQYHPVSLFTSIRFIDELAQFITPKRVAEMNLEDAWKWEMSRVADLVYESVCQGYLPRNKMIKAMSNRLQIILNDERKKYETE